MIRAKDGVILVALAWFLLRDRESTSVELKQTCIDGDGNLYEVPLGDCPPGTTLFVDETHPNQSPPYVPQLNGYGRRGLRGCGGGCGGNCGGCR